MPSPSGRTGTFMDILFIADPLTQFKIYKD